MAISHQTALRQVLADAAVDSLDAGAGTNPTLVMLEGATVIATFDLDGTAAFGAANGSAVATATGLPISTTVGQAPSSAIDGFELRDKDATMKIQGSVTSTGGGGDIEMGNAAPALNDTLNLTSLTYTGPA